MGSQNSTSTSTPLTAAQRQETYDAGMKNMSSALPTTGYTEPVYQDNGSAKTLTDGDYQALQDSITTARTTPLDRAWSLRKDDINQEMADRGLWSSGAPLQQQSKEYESSFLPQYAAAGAEAATQRYNLQSAENTAANSYNLQSTAAKNAFETEQAKQKYEASWRPADYAAGVWNGTGGTVSSGTSGGWSI